MGLYIKGMELPKEEDDYTEVWIYGDGKVAIRKGIKLIWGKSAIEVPDSEIDSLLNISNKSTKECHSEYLCKELPYSKECETCAAYYNEDEVIEV